MLDYRWTPEGSGTLVQMNPFDLGQAAVLLARSAEKQAAATLSYGLRGRLVFSPSGYVLLEVPNDLGNGAFKALAEPGIEQPVSKSRGHYNAHVSVIRPDEVESIGGPDKIKQRGHTFAFTLGPVREINNPAGWSEVSKCWVIDIRSPELMQLRRSLGLGDPKFPFHLTFAIRKKNALRKSASFIHFKQAAQATEIKDSPIHGRGLFATQDFSDGDVVLPKLMTEAPSDDGRTRWEQSEEARFTNHSENPNTEVVREDGYVKMRATRDIKAGEELTASYDAASTHLGPGFYYTYRGKPYNGETDDDTQGDGDTAIFGPSYQASHSICETLRDRAVGESEDEPRRKLAVDGRWHLPGGDGEGRDGVRGEAVDRDGHRGHSGPGQSSILKLAAEIKPVPNLAPQPTAEEADDEKKKLERAVNRNQRERKARRIAAAMDKVAAEKCPGCGKPFPKGEPYPDVDMCEVCERYGPPKLIKEGTDLVMQIAAARKVTQKPKSEAQAEAGNYPKGKVSMHGFTVALENPKGSTRSGTDPSGKKWSVKMKHDYGYIHRTIGRDGDHVDVFIGPDPHAELVYVVDQQDPSTGKFDEHKCMLGFTTEAAAREAYLSNYEDNWKGLKSITALTMPQFKWWIKNGDMKKPVDGAKVKVATDSYYLNAINQTPMSWDAQRGVAQNLMQNLSRVKTRGDRAIQEAASYDRLQNAMDPDRASRQFTAYLAGQRSPIVSHPLDRFVQEVGS